MADDKAGVLCFYPYAPYVSAVELAEQEPANFANTKGNHECVEFVRQITGAPSTKSWRPGKLVKGNADIPLGAAIANFSGSNYYTHAAIYIEQNAEGLVVADQWNKQGRVKRRTIKFPKAKETRKPSDNGDIFFLIDPPKSNEAAKGNGEKLVGRIISA